MKDSNAVVMQTRRIIVFPFSVPSVTRRYAPASDHGGWKLTSTIAHGLAATLARFFLANGCNVPRKHGP
jgi:hypothetical protein